ncbi:hypothetical protein DFH05DRAFT_1526833 [Lentinula detonsa]|uniref:Uncharacterized protein n=1 Tax=Lentinula detonsa TaxID=2804962 RepID=A0A9W8NWI1_9AGAR|nr:hypothetical protein DFH05DRAFT_1526833 [Lentinula detonsa]
MAERIEIDPSKIPRPDFAGAAYGFVRRALVADPDTPDVTTDEEAVQKLRGQWEIENNTLRTQFQIVRVMLNTAKWTVRCDAYPR